ncbi:hypothetical protein Tco_1161759, partial [Tanacetum coccineum]
MNMLQMMFEHSSSSLGPHCLMMSVHISSGLVLHLDDVWTKHFKPLQASFFILMTFDHSSSSLGPHCLMMSVHISSGLVLHLEDVWTKQFRPRLILHLDVVWTKQFQPLQTSFLNVKWRLLASLQALFLKVKKGVRLQRKGKSFKLDEKELALKLGKSISLTEAEEEAVAREVHATHARIVSESDSSKKLKGIQTLTPAEQEAADIMKALNESKKISKRQPGTGGSNEQSIPEQLNVDRREFTDAVNALTKFVFLK